MEQAEGIHCQSSARCNQMQHAVSDPEMVPAATALGALCWGGGVLGLRSVLIGHCILISLLLIGQHILISLPLRGDCIPIRLLVTGLCSLNGLLLNAIQSA